MPSAAISLRGRGIVPCPHNVGEVHLHDGPPITPAEAISLLSRARSRHARLGVAISNLHRILIEERLLAEDASDPPLDLLEAARQTLSLALSVLPGGQSEALSQITRTLERLDAYQDRLAPRGVA